MSPEEAAETVVYLVTDPSAAESEALYWKDCRPKAPSAYARRPAEAARLWELSARLVRPRRRVRGTFGERHLR